MTLVNNRFPMIATCGLYSSPGYQNPGNMSPFLDEFTLVLIHADLESRFET
jgi:hypothetical protein